MNCFREVKSQRDNYHYKTGWSSTSVDGYNGVYQPLTRSWFTYVYVSKRCQSPSPPRTDQMLQVAAEVDCRSDEHPILVVQRKKRKTKKKTLFYQRHPVTLSILSYSAASQQVINDSLCGTYGDPVRYLQNQPWETVRKILAPSMTSTISFSPWFHVTAIYRVIFFKRSRLVFNA